jgi:hypothetical protein
VADGDAVMHAVDVGVQARARGEVKRRVFRRDRRATAFSYAWRAVRSLAVQPDAGERDLGGRHQRIGDRAEHLTDIATDGHLRRDASKHFELLPRIHGLSLVRPWPTRSAGR